MILLVGHFTGCAFCLLAYIEKYELEIEYTWLERINK